MILQGSTEFPSFAQWFYPESPKIIERKMYTKHHQAVGYLPVAVRITPITAVTLNLPELPIFTGVLIACKKTRHAVE